MRMKKIIITVLVAAIVIYLAILVVVNKDKKEFNKAFKENPSQQDSIKINDTTYHFKTKEK